MKLSADKLPVSNDRRLKFIVSSDSYEICCLYVAVALHCKDFEFKLTFDARIQPVFLNSGGEDEIYAVSLKLFPLTAEADRVLC